MRFCTPVALTVTMPGSWVGTSRHSLGSMVRVTGVVSLGLESSTIASEARSWLELPAEARCRVPLRSAYSWARLTASTIALWSGSSLQLYSHGST
ncbi:hypothetical protein SGRIM128S_07347 [Streptomyces griseomycini]